MIHRAVKMFLSSRRMMNSRRLCNSHQRHKFLRAEEARNILKIISSLRNGVSRVFQEVFSTADTMLFHQNTRKTGNNAVEMSQAFQDIPRFKHFTDLNLFINMRSNWCFTILFDGAYFLLAVMVKGDESSLLRMAN